MPLILKTVATIFISYELKSSYHKLGGSFWFCHKFEIRAYIIVKNITRGGVVMRRLSRMNELLEIPREIVSKVPKITVTSFDEVLIENFKGILEYEEFFVRISTHIGNININGFNLKLSQMTEDDILVSGKIEGLDFESKRGED